MLNSEPRANALGNQCEFIIEPIVPILLDAFVTLTTVTTLAACCQVQLAYKCSFAVRNRFDSKLHACDITYHISHVHVTSHTVYDG